MNNNWLSIDPSKAGTGVAVWEGRELQHSFVIKPRGTKGKYYFDGFILDSRHEVFGRLPALASTKLDCYIEKGMGRHSNAIRAQGWMCGYIDSKFEAAGRKSPIEVVVSEWRRVIKEDQGISWPAKRVRKKALAIDLVKELYNLDVCDDEADAILLGRACIRMFNIKDKRDV